jgi:DNA-binding transcriptional ArsR family regulator
MSTPLPRALAYLDALEADRQAALALCEQKAEEARLIKARQEGFRAAMELLGAEIPVGNAEAELEEPSRRRTRRRIPQLILRELSFSGQAVSATQIAKAIGYNLEGTQTALTRLEKAGQVLRNGEGRWAIGITATPRLHEHPAAGNGKYASPGGVE